MKPTSRFCIRLDGWVIRKTQRRIHPLRTVHEQVRSVLWDRVTDPLHIPISNRLWKAINQ